MIRAYAATAGVLLRAARRALPDAVAAAYIDGIPAGLRTWHRLVVADIVTLTAVDEAIFEALLTGEVREKVER